MSSFLSAAENVSRQRQNVQRDLKKMEKKSRAVELAFEGHSLLISGLCCTGKIFLLHLDNFIYIFGTIVTINSVSLLVISYEMAY